MSRRFEGNTFLFRTRIGEDGVKQEGNNQFADATATNLISNNTGQNRGRSSSWEAVDAAKQPRRESESI